MVDTPENNDSPTQPSAAKKAARTVETVAEQVAAAAQGAADDAEKAIDTAVSATSSSFNKAIEDAKASAAAMKEQAIERSAAVREKVTETASDWSEQAAQMAAQAKEKGLDLANQGKSKASEALATVGTAISDNAGFIDEKLGVQYGDYVRGTAKSIKETAAKLEAKELSEIGDDVAGFVRKSPATALGIAAFSGFLFARLFRRSGSSDT
jgi:phage-related tail protein